MLGGFSHRSVGGEREKGVSEEPGLAHSGSRPISRDQSVERIMRVAVEAARFRCR